MHNKLLIIFLLSLFPIMVSGQWRVGVTGGATLNHYAIDKHYMEDWHYDDGWGATFGVFGQYDFMTWKKWAFGIRADLNWTQKNRLENHLFHTNNYIQLPVMICTSYGKNLRCFVNLGAYGGCWCSKKVSGDSYYGLVEVEKENRPPLHVEEKEFDSKRDQQADFGFVGGVGVEYQISKYLVLQMEIRDFYSVTSAQKDYMRIKDPRYNNTIALQGGICWVF